jgi:hypothetical protein
MLGQGYKYLCFKALLELVPQKAIERLVDGD